MDLITRMSTAVIAGLISAFVLTGCSGDPQDPASAIKARPVTVLELEERDFARETRLTGSVSLYREEQVGFEVAGRLLWVLDEGKEVEGPTLDENGRLIKPGELIAKLDNTRYRLQVNALQARLDAARQALKETRSALKLARQTRNRQKRIFDEDAGSLFVPVDSIYREGGRSYVLRLPGVSFHPGARRSAVGKHLPDKVPVTLGNDYFTVIKWNFRSLEAGADLREGDFLVLKPKQEHLAGLAIGRAQWLLRPGELVPVRFMLDATPKGLYVPMTAITMINDKHVVFLAEDDRARMTEVTVHDLYHKLRRIGGEGIAPGARVIVSGVHYVSDGQPVTVVGYEQLPP